MDACRRSGSVPGLVIPLSGDFSVGATSGAGAASPVIAACGPYRFVEVGGRLGYQPLSLRTELHIPTDIHLRDEGSLALYVAPLESLGTAPGMWGFESRDPHAREYGLLSDSFPVNDTGKSVFGWFWRSVWHPQMIAKFKLGAAAGGHADYGVTPYVPVEHLPLREREWYEFVLTWNKPQSRLRLYVNGILCGTTSYPFRAETPKPGLYLGNTAMIFANFRAFEAELTEAEVTAQWLSAGYVANAEVQEELMDLFTVRSKPAIDWQPDAPWTLCYENTLLRKECDDAGAVEKGLPDWIQQGCLEPGFELKERRVTPEGLLLETPDRIHVESRVYMWSPCVFEGDLAVEFDFRPEREDGLALLVVQATGMQREDFIADHPPRTTGSMSTIIGDRVRNYHWEFFRHSVDVRGDVGTSVLVKNPWEHPLGMSTRKPFVTGRWYKLLFVQEGDRLRAGIDGEWLLDVRDTSFGNQGPVLNSGRVGLRLMYQTRMCFRQLRIWNRVRPAGGVGTGADS